MNAIKNEITLTAGMLEDAISLVDNDLDTEITIKLMEPWLDEESGEMQPAGFYASYEEYPEYGLYGPLGVVDR